jgi:acyl carrier protein
LTGERFVPDSFGNVEGARLYRTGDQARYLPDGSIEYMGRIDHQVKLRGYRIELGEIEAALEEHEAVREAAVVVKGEAENYRLTAFVVSHRESASLVTELKNYLREMLPDHMVPSAFVVLEALPLTPNGKVDRKQLMSIEVNGQDREMAYLAPRNHLEEAIAKIWQDVLRVEKVGINDNFFDLGGHSLTLIEAHSKLRETAGIEIALIEMFHYPTIASLAMASLTIASPEGSSNGVDEATAEQSLDRAERRREKTRQQREFRGTRRTAKADGS